jgi:CHAD domain-containing protein
MTVADAITATLVSCTEHVRANIPGAKRGEDPEALHQLRVGVRRLRAALSAYREAIPPVERRAVSRAFRRFERNLSPA